MKPVDIEILGHARLIDICPSCQTTWFDHLEFEHMPLAPQAEEAFVLPPEVREALGDIELREGRVVANRKSFRLDARDFGLGWDRTREGTPGGWRLILGLLGIPVERDLNVAHKPWATWSLITLTFFISYLGFSDPAIIEALALRGTDVWKWGGLTLLTYFFVHGGWFHLLSNLYYLWLFGDNVEDEVGPITTLVIVALGTAAGALLHVWLDPSGGLPLVGASGGISTLGMMYMLRYPRAKLAFFILVRWVRVPAYALLVVWAVLQINGAFEQMSGLTQVSALCHVGGALVGLVAHFVLLRRPPQWRF
jgi:membrane associated rhomboid family serine protease